MNTLSRNDIKALAENVAGPCVSIYLPTHRAGAETQQDPLRLRNQIRVAENRLLADGLRSTKVEDLLAPLRDLIDQGDFWRYPDDGLAIFRSPDVFRYYWLPSSFKDLVVVANHFHLKPLLPLLANDGRFYVLAVSQKAVRLLEASRYSITAVELPESIPESVAEFMKYEEHENDFQYHSSASGATIGKGGRHPAVFHGAGVGIDDNKDDILRYFRRIDKGLHEIVRDEQVPLLLACVDYLLPIYREANTYAHLMNQLVEGNPDRLSAQELHKRAWAVMEPHFMEAQQVAAAQYKEYEETERASREIDEIVTAASHGRVESLFVARDEQEWGTFNPDTNLVHIHQQPEPADEDLLDFAAVQTLLHHGAVYALEREQVPGGELLAAVFRY